VAYSPATPPVNASSAMAEKIQPMGFLGRWATTKAPTTMKAPKPSTNSPKLAGSCWKLSSATARTVAKATLTMKITSMDQATQVQRLPTAFPRLQRNPSRLQTVQRSTPAPSRERYELRNNDRSSRSIPDAANRTGRRRTGGEPPATRRQQPTHNDTRCQGRRHDHSIAAGHELAVLVFTRQRSPQASAWSQADP
jgi:hypothetical protein